MFYWWLYAQALTVYFYGGYGCSFQCCFLVFRFSSCLLKQWCMAQIQGFILLALREFPEVLFLSLVNNSENMGDGFARKPGFDPGLGRSPGEGNGNPLQYSYLENPMDRGAWQATVHRVAKSRTRLSNFTHSTHSLTQVLESLEASPSIAWATCSWYSATLRSSVVSTVSPCCQGLRTLIIAMVVQGAADDFLQGKSNSLFTNKK